MAEQVDDTSPGRLSLLLDRAKAPRWVAVAVGLVIVLAVAGSLSWIEANRAYFVLDTDEMGYLATSLEASDAVRDGDLGGAVETLARSGNTAPLLGTLTVPVHLLLGRGLTASLVPQLVFLAMVIVSTFLLARSFVSTRWALLACAVTAWAPGVVSYSRAYHFALPATAMFTAASAAVVRSRGFTKLPWAIAWGAFTGLALLSRTMMLALVPGLLLAGAIAYWAGSRDRQARRALVTGAGVFVLVAGPWWLLNWRPVLDYLTDAGYGAESSQYTGGEGRFHVFLDLVTRLGPFTCLLLAAIVLLVVGCAHAREQGYRSWVGESMADGVGLLVVTTIWTLVVLSTTQNRGSAFDLPIVPTLITLGVIAIAAIPRVRVRRTCGVLVSCLLLVALAQSFGAGAGTIDFYVASSGYPSDPDLAPVLDEVASELLDDPAGARSTGVTAGDYFFNPNSVRMATQLGHRTAITPIAVTEADDLDDLTRLYIVDPGPVLAGASANSVAITEAALQRGFTVVRTLDLPDGRQVTQFERTT